MAPPRPWHAEGSAFTPSRHGSTPSLARWGQRLQSQAEGGAASSMAAVFLVTLYEYSPLFYIALVSVCFLVTSALVLGWFGLGVPVILRNSEERESSTRVLKKQMRQVKNPFGLEISNPAAASVTRGVVLTPDCLEDCVLTCYWGCNVQKLHEALQKHVYCFRIKTPQALEDALYNEYLYKQQYFIKKNDKAEKYCQLPEDAQVVDFGPVPRARYPLVALLTLADEEDREIHDIIAMVAVIHVPDESYRLSCRILYQYLLLAQGQYHDLKQLFMSANSPALSPSDTFPGESSTDRGLAGGEPELQEENSKDCVVCQNGPVNWVLLPCRHTCLCDGCIRYFQQCPMCRQFVQESFPLCSKKEQDEDESTRVLQDVLPGRVF
ncbi:cell growth regulator with RING finger domain protein 1 [Onychostruthus taczanowskii]|uniref:cell growth regulator with RING finger domain protein 1 n=1 Tax=Onychostruthus taczanowskii TaxID=356909 RepID=UPI001B80D078|nr:cell growth regulator with RING finger domain protein 1 [Onychostruthus taczanowskii]